MSVEERSGARGVGARPVWLAVEPDPVLAFLHLAEPGAERDTAVLICPPFGWQDNCSYRGRRRWAASLARAGYSSARFSLPGTGDSGGSPRDPGQLVSWTGAVAATARWLADTTGAARIVAIGVGLGGMLACRAVARGARIDDLILWAVPSEGRALVRELTAYAQIVASRRPEDHLEEPVPEGDLECVGFRLSAETLRDLSEIRLPTLELPSAEGRRVLLLGRDGIAPDARLREYLERSGAAVTVKRTADYSSLMLHPQESQTPAETIATTISWLSDGSSNAGEDRAPVSGRSAIERSSIGLRWGGTAIRETPLRFEAPGGELFGVLTEAEGIESAPVCAVWLNGGAVPHTGPNRVWVEAARRWATRGVPTVRVDPIGIGDSEGDPETIPNADLYAPERFDEVMVVLDQLADRGLPNRFIVGGLCSGAYWSMHAALADPRVAGLMLMNLSVFFWTDAIAAERAASVSLGAMSRYGWRRLIHRDITLRQVRQVLGNIRPAQLRSGAGHPAERVQDADIEPALDQLRDQRTQALLLLGKGEALYDQLKRQGALDQLHRWPNLTLERIPSTDHMFRALWLQDYVHDALDRALERVLAAEDERS